MVVYWFFFKPLSHVLKNITLRKLGSKFRLESHSPLALHRPGDQWLEPRLGVDMVVADSELDGLSQSQVASVAYKLYNLSSK